MEHLNYICYKYSLFVTRWMLCPSPFSTCCI